MDKKSLPPIPNFNIVRKVRSKFNIVRQWMVWIKRRMNLEVHTLIRSIYFIIKLWFWKFDIKITSLNAQYECRGIYIYNGGIYFRI